MPIRSRALQQSSDLGGRIALYTWSGSSQKNYAPVANRSSRRRPGQQNVFPLTYLGAACSVHHLRRDLLVSRSRVANRVMVVISSGCASDAGIATVSPDDLCALSPNQLACPI